MKIISNSDYKLYKEMGQMIMRLNENNNVLEKQISYLSELNSNLKSKVNELLKENTETLLQNYELAKKLLEVSK